MERKKEWVGCLLPPAFDVGIRTTSRAESNNNVIKKYVNSKSELSDLITLIIHFEKTFLVLI
jgi:hypothetical protein